jgi:hypothetical protein
MNEENLTRRGFLGRVVAMGAATVGAGAFLAACEKGDAKADAPKGDAKADAKPAGELKCDDVAGLAEPDKATRTNNQYVDKSTTPGKNCANCQLYKPAAAGACGACTLVKGPIHPEGYCRVWVKKA